MEQVGVFISHISEESDLGKLVKGLLKEDFGDDLKVFLSSDYESITSGSDWFNDILSTIKSSQVLIAILSKESMNRPWINFEVGVGKGADALVVPALVRGLTKAEAVPPLSHLQLRDFENSDDVLGALKDIAQKLNKNANGVNTQGFVTALKTTGSSLPLRDVSLTPYLESCRSDGHCVRFRLANTGNQNIRLSYIEASVPKSVIDPNWTPHSDPVVIPAANEDRNGNQYLRLRYTTYEGAKTSNYQHVERLQAVLPPDTRLELGLHFGFPIKATLSETEKTHPIYYRIVALDANFPQKTTTLGELLDQLTAPPEKSQTAEKPARGPSSSEPQSRRSEWLGDRTKIGFLVKRLGKVGSVRESCWFPEPNA